MNNQYKIGSKFTQNINTIFICIYIYILITYYLTPTHTYLTNSKKGLLSLFATEERYLRSSHLFYKELKYINIGVFST